MHNAFLNINHKKMSKSLNNFFTVREISEKYDLQVLRFFMLSAHYRSPLNFGEELMESSANALERIINACDGLRDAAAAGTAGAVPEEVRANAAAYLKKYEAAMEDDFNTADALAAVFELVKYANILLKEGISAETAHLLLEHIETMCGICGIKTKRSAQVLDEEIERLIAERQQARKEKNFRRADEIRDLLSAQGIILEDTREGVKWKKA